MKRGLPSLCYSSMQVKKHLAHWMCTLLVAIWCTGQLSAQVPSIGTNECNCIAGVDPDDPIFSDRVIIQGSPSVTWTVVSATGLFVPNSDPLQPISAGATITENFPGVYILEAVRREGEPFTVDLSDGTTTFTRSNVHTCSYPLTTIQGDMGSCVGNTKVYSLDVDPDELFNVNWSVTGGTIISETETQLRVEWPTVGSGTVSVTGQAATNADIAGDLCDFDESVTVEVMNEEAIVLACNNRLNITMGPSCEVTLTPSTLLQDMMFSDASYNLVLKDIKADTIIPTSRLDGRYLDKDIEVSVIHECSGNSCWGNIRLEDKSMPSLMCPDTSTVDCNEATDPSATGFPIPASSSITQIDDNTFFVDGFDQCGGLTLDFYDEVNSNLCDGPFASEITRLWQATDNAGNTDTCSQIIRVRRATFDDLTFPPIYDDVLGDGNGGEKSLQACGNWPQLPNGYPDPDFTGRPMGTFCINVQVDYTDQLISGCSDVSFKIKRRWQVSDLCGSGRDTVYNQIITVGDNEPPVCQAPNEFGVGTNVQSCDAVIDVPAPEVVFECSGWDYQVSYKLVDDSGDPFSFSTTDGVVRKPNGEYRINNVPAGQDTVWIIYTIMDDCGNFTECFTEVGLVDNEEPVTVCDLYTFVAVNEEGIAFAGPSAFDDGTYDNCELDSLDVRRMDDACGEVSAWGEKVKFCCEDVGNTVMVALRAFDKAGNSNQCMVEVQVQDNIPPTITSKPQDITVNCTADVLGLAQYGTITAEDVCGVTISEDVDRSNSRCGEGEVIRTFTATDASGNSSTHQQRITLTNLDPFFINRNNPNDSRDDVVWPRDYTTNTGCLAGGLEPEDLPAANGFPRTFENSCSEVSVTHKDVVFQYVDQACYKILRTWTIIDFCQFNPFFPQGAGQWTYTQVIKVTNSTPPTILTGCGPDDAQTASAGNCRGSFSISATGSDDCTPADELEWSYRIDVGDNGTYDYIGSGNSFSDVIDFASVRVEWTVRDQCGNTETCDNLYVVGDQKKPTPYCLSEVVTVLMEQDGNVAIWASDFDSGSFDDCSPVTVSFSANTSETSMEFTCADVPNGIEEMIPVEIWVTDESGNQDFCTATLTLQDNSDVCLDTIGVIDTLGGNRVAIAGRVATEESQPLDDVEVSILASVQELSGYEMTGLEGQYAFSDLLTETDYVIEPVKVDNHDRGVSTLDLVMIQRHILGLAQLDSPYKVIAADINNSESVSGADVVALRKLILGITDEFDNNDAWRFVDASQTFDDPLRPFPFVEKLGYQKLSSDMANVDFVAVKIGDVNGSAETSRIAGDESVDNRSAIQLDGQFVKRNGKTYLMVRSEAITNLVGLQLTIKYPEQVSIRSVQSEVLEITDDQIGWDAAATGMLPISWHRGVPSDITDGEVLLMLEVEGDTDEVSIGDGLLDAEIYTAGGNELTTQTITYKRDGSTSSPYRLYQNVPNPFDATTLISFELGEAGPAVLSIYDINGRLIYQISDEYKAGLHNITLDVDALQATGILYYQLDSKSYTASKKMVVIR